MRKLYKQHLTFYRSLQFVFFSCAIFFKPANVFGLAENLKKPKERIKKEKLFYGKTKKGQKLYAIRMYKENHKLPMRPAALVTGGIHGNEYMGLVEGLAQGLDETSAGFKEFFNAGGVLYFFPKLNPDGVSKGNRFNSHGVDLNRDFKMDRKPSQTESIHMVDFLEKDLDKLSARLIFAMDYHCCSKSLIYPKMKGEDAFYKSRFSKVVEFMKAHVDPEYKSGVTRDIFGYDTHGTLKGYWFKKFGALSFTYEGADPKEEIKKLSGHLSWWKDIMGLVVDIYDNHLVSLKPQNSELEVRGESPAYYTE